MLLSLFHPPCKVKKSLMHLDHSRGGGGKRRKESETAFFSFYLQIELQCLFVVLMHPLQAPFGLIWHWGFFGYRFGGIFEVANLLLLYF